MELEPEVVVAKEGVTVNEQLESKQNHVMLCAIAAIVIVCTCSVIQSYSKVDDCSYHLRDGYTASNGQWQSNWCIVNHYQEEKLRECLNTWDLVVVIGGRRSKEYSLFLEEYIMKNRVEFILLPEVNEEVHQIYQDISVGKKSLLVLHMSSLVITSTDSLSDRVQETCKKKLSSLLSAQEDLQRIVPQTHVVLLSPESDELHGSKSCASVAQEMYSNKSNPSLVYLDLSMLGSNEPIPKEMDLVLNTFCDSTCCASRIEVSFFVYLSSSLIIAILALYLGFYLVFISGATFALTPYLEARSFDLDQFFSVLHAVGAIAALVLYMQLTDRWDYFTRVSIDSNYLVFGLFLLGSILLTLLTLQHKDKVNILSSGQCNEWRGWMVMLLIFLRYCGLDQMFIGSVILNVIIGGFLFLSGYCYFSSSWTEENFTWKKSVLVLVRLNSFPLLVTASLGSSYGLYYLIPLLSLSYLLVVVFVFSWPALHISTGGIQRRIIGGKFLVFYVILLILPLFKNFVMDMLPFLKSDHSSTLYNLIENQRFNPLWGMLVGYILAIAKSKYSSIILHMEYQLRVFAVVSGAVLSLVYCVSLSMFPSVQGLLGTLPILSYLLLRNGIYPLCSYESYFLNGVGTLSIWLYVSHHHILLASDGRGILVLIPKLFLGNIVLIVVVFVMVFIVIRNSLHTLKQVKSLQYFTFVSNV